MSCYVGFHECYECLYKIEKGEMKEDDHCWHDCHECGKDDAEDEIVELQAEHTAALARICDNHGHRYDGSLHCSLCRYPQSLEIPL